MDALLADLQNYIDTDQYSSRSLLDSLEKKLPQSVAVRTLIAQAHMRIEEIDLALDNFNKALELNPQDLDLRCQVGVCTLAMGDYEKAFAIFSECQAAAPSEVAQVMMGLLAHRLGRIDEAVKTYTSLLATLKPDHSQMPHALRGLAFALRDQGLHIESDRYLAQLAVLFRANPAVVAVSLIDRDNSSDHPGWTDLERKEGLERTLRFAEGKPWKPRHPASFVLPADRDALLGYAASNPNAWFIAKPQHGINGHNATISCNVNEIADLQGVIAQRYIEKPYLIDGKKAHLRIHGLVTSFNPLRAYYHNEGVVRFAPETYSLSEDSPVDIHAHISGTAIHKGHPKLVISENANEENVGGIWSLTAYLERMRQDGVDVKRVKEGLQGLMLGFLRAVEAEGLIGLHDAYPRRSFVAKFFGLDVILDSEARPWLIEAHRNVATRGTPLVNKIMAKTAIDIFQMGCCFAIEDKMPAEQIAVLSKDSRALLRREAEHEVQFKGGFERLI